MKPRKRLGRADPPTAASTHYYIHVRLQTGTEGWAYFKELDGGMLSIAAHARPLFAEAFPADKIASTLDLIKMAFIGCNCICLRDDSEQLLPDDIRQALWKIVQTANRRN